MTYTSDTGIARAVNAGITCTSEPAAKHGRRPPIGAWISPRPATAAALQASVPFTETMERIGCIR